MKSLFYSFGAGCIVAALLLPASLFAQVHVEEEMSTDSINVFQKDELPGKSGAIAMTANLLLPGLGHYYFGNEKAAHGFFAAEALFIFGAFACNQYAKEIAASAHAFAFLCANVQGGMGADDFFWDNIGKFMDSDGLNQSREAGYNQAQGLNRAGDGNKYLAPNLQWRWQDEASRQQYNNYMKKSLNYRVASSFFIGAMILNRLVSFIDIRVASRHNGKGLFSSLQIYPRFAASTGLYGIACVSTF